MNSENELIFDKKYSQVRLDISNHLINNENLKKILYDKRIFSTIKKYLNKTDVKITNIGVIHSHPFKNPTRKQKYHIDNYNGELSSIINNNKLIKLFIPLCDVNVDNGATKIIIGSRENLLPLIKNDNNNNKLTSFEDDIVENYYEKEKIISMNSNFGEVFLARTDGIHKGGHVLKKYRTIIIVEYR